MVSDNNDDLWYLGSVGDPDMSIWKFDTSTFQWGWYGTLGGAAPAFPPTYNNEYAGQYRPGRRLRHAMCYAGNYLYLFGMSLTQTTNT
jgi:hypothetical protein